MSTTNRPAKGLIRQLKRLVAALLIVLMGPLLVVACGKVNISSDWRTADRSPQGIAPSAEQERQAVVQVYAARAFNWRGIFAVHTWVAVKPAGASNYVVHQVLGWQARRGLPVVVSMIDAPDRSWYAENLLTGCAYICGQCHQSLDGWLDRRQGRRATLQQIGEKYNTPDGRRHLRALITLTESALRAAVWREDFLVGALPYIKEPRSQTAAERAASAKGGRRAQERRREEKTALEKARRKRLGNPPEAA